MEFLCDQPWKNTCDGIGGTVKRLAARASLQSPLVGQILSVRQLFDWCVGNIQHITFFFVTAADVDSHRALLDDRFVSARAIPGTRDNHSFVPLSHTDMKISRVSGEDAHFIDRQGNMDVPAVQGPTSLPFQPGTYVASMYDGHWWLGCIVEVCLEHEDYKVKFMQPCGPAVSFSWPKNDDICWVPHAHVLCSVPIPRTTRNERQYKVDDATREEIGVAFEIFKQMHQ